MVKYKNKFLSKKGQPSFYLRFQIGETDKVEWMAKKVVRNFSV